MTSRRVDLHIGLEKTGTTTVQHTLAASGEVLAQHGVLYPTTLGLGHVNHTSLAIVGRDDDVVDDLRIRAGCRTPAEVVAFRDETRAALAAEVAAHPGARVVLSNEHCSSRLQTTAEVERLVTWLVDALAADVHVHVYLRRQDRLVESRHSTAVRAGVASRLSFTAGDELVHWMQYDRLLDLWAGVVGADHVHPRRFERARLVGGDVVADLAAALDLPLERLVRRAETNRALDASTQHLAERLTERVPRFVDGAVNPAHRLLVRALDAVEPEGPPARLPAADRDRLLAAARPGNERVAQEWFGEAELFAPVRDADDAGGAVDPDRVVEVAAEVVAYMAAVLGARDR